MKHIKTYNESNQKNNNFKVDDLVKYKDTAKYKNKNVNDESIFKIYRINDSTSKTEKSGYMRDIKKNFPLWVHFNDIRYLTELEKSVNKYNL